MESTVYETHLTHLKLLNRGKVRDIYACGDDHLLIVTTDRLSAFDVVLPTAVPNKGKILTQVSNFWFKHLGDLVNNHLSDRQLDDLPLSDDEYEQLEGRSIIVKKLHPLPVEAIVRGYLIGSGWKDYQRKGQVCGIKLPSGLHLADRLPETLFTPSTKADVGDHDININFAQMANLVGSDLAQQIRKASLSLYQEAATYALKRGIIIADTKFEFGVDSDGRLVLIDEILTPDSSRFWEAKSYRSGSSPVSFDKQFVRDYLESLDWDKTSPGPELPADIAEKTAAKYQEVYQRLTEI